MNQHDLVKIARDAYPNCNHCGWATSMVAGEGIIAAVFGGIVVAMASGDEVKIAGFGTFSVAKRPARVGRNPRTGEEITIPARQAVTFKPFGALKDALNPEPRVGGGRMQPGNGKRARA
jgi:DNA-binding protein HU-beta